MKVAAHRNVSNLSSKYLCFIKYNDYIEPIKLILQLINKISNKFLISLKSSITIATSSALLPNKTRFNSE